MNLFYPSRVPSLGGKFYTYVIVYGFSRFIWVLFLSHRKEAFQAFSKRFEMKKVLQLFE